MPTMVHVRLRKNVPPERFEVVSVGAFTVRLRRDDGVIVAVKRKRVEQQLPAALLTPKVRFTETPTPTGGQPTTGKRRRRAE